MGGREHCYFFLDAVAAVVFSQQAKMTKNLSRLELYILHD